jgi:hypothetical protein
MGCHQALSAGGFHDRLAVTTGRSLRRFGQYLDRTTALFWGGVTMYCAKCGTELPDRARHCFECGTPVGETQPTTTGVRRRIVCIIGDKSLFQRAVFLVEPDGHKRETASDDSFGRLEAMLLSDGWTRVPGGMSPTPTYEKWIEE